MRLADILCLSGLVLLAVAAWLVYPPLSIGGAGAVLLGAGVVLHRRVVVKPKNPKEQ